MSEKKRQIFAPQAAWIKNGTTSSAHDKMMFERRADAKRRREQEDARFQTAAKKPNQARVHQHKLGSRRNHPCAVLGVKHPKDRRIDHYMVCEITHDEGSSDLMLMMQCPRCIFSYDRSPDDSIMHIRQSNRAWHLDRRTKNERSLNPVLRTCAGELWISPEDRTEVVMVAGMVTTDDWCKCPICKWEFTIDDSIVYTRN